MDINESWAILSQEFKARCEGYESDVDIDDSATSFTIRPVSHGNNCELQIALLDEGMLFIKIGRTIWYNDYASGHSGVGHAAMSMLDIVLDERVFEYEWSRNSVIIYTKIKFESGGRTSQRSSVIPRFMGTPTTRIYDPYPKLADI